MSHTGETVTGGVVTHHGEAGTESVTLNTSRGVTCTRESYLPPRGVAYMRAELKCSDGRRGRLVVRMFGRHIAIEATLDGAPVILTWPSLPSSRPWTGPPSP